MLSDRMVSTGDTEYEPMASKISGLTSSIAMMYSGDAHFFAEVAQDVYTEVHKRIKADPDDWLTVHAVARIWSNAYTEARFRHAEPTVLGPYGLDRKTFAQQALTLDPALAEKLTKAMLNFSVPSVEVIIAGIDQRHGYASPAIWSALDEEIMCGDQLSFVAIGKGARHAEAQFMFANYGYQVPNGEALLIAYGAKKSAEVAPGVGSGTDAIAIGADLGKNYRLPDAMMKKLDIEYRKVKDAEARARKRATTEMSSFLTQQNARPAIQQSSGDEEKN